MPVYNYRALKDDGGADAGVIDADSPKDARLKLKNRRLHVTDLQTVGGGTDEKGAPRKRRFQFLARRRPQEIAMLTRQMATLLGSGIPMISAITALIDQVEYRDLKSAMMDIREKVSQGGSLSVAMSHHPVYFGELFVNMVGAGEAGGNLDKVLFRVADYMHAQNRTRAKVMAALTYPIIMLLIGSGVVVILLTYVVPKIMEVIQKQKAALPLPTEILLAVSGFMGKYWWLLLAITATTVAAYFKARATKKGRLWIDTMKLRIPVLGNLLKKSAISRFAITFATLLESGLPVLEAMSVVRKVVDNELLAETLDMVRQKISEGADIATPLKQSKVFPPVVGYMIGVGEESGRLEELLKKTAEAYDEEVDVAAQKMTSLLEPLMIVVMSIVVGFIVLSILLPILEMSNI